MRAKTKNLVKKLENIFSENKDKRIVVVGTTCTGKSFLFDETKIAFPVSKLRNPLLTEKEKNYVYGQNQWAPEIGKKMIELTREKVKVKPGVPLFGTVVLDCDLIVYLTISDKLLKERCKLRDVDFKNAKGMQKQIEEEIRKAKAKTIKISVG
jgi:hypothetical protein